MRVIAHSNPVPHAIRIIFIDESGDFIALKPKEKAIDASFDHESSQNDNFAYLPTNYELYDVYSITITDADLDAVEQWPLKATIVMGFDQQPTEAVLERFGRIRETHPNLRWKDAPKPIICDFFGCHP